MQEESDYSKKVAVVLRGFPEIKMTEEQAEKVEAALVEEINRSVQEEPIQFSASEYVKGALVFTCDNKATRLWLHKYARRLLPWHGARLAVGNYDTTLNGTTLVMWVVTEVCKKSNEQILDLLQKQNMGISTAKWKVYRRETEKDVKSDRLTVWVDMESYEHLKAHDLKLFLGLNQTKFLQWSEWNKLKWTSTERLAPEYPIKRHVSSENPIRRHANYVSSGPRYTRQLTRIYAADKPMSPWLVPPRGLSRDAWTPGSGSQAGHRPWLTGLSDPNPLHRIEDQYWSQSQPKFLDTDSSYFREAQATSSDPLWPYEYMESAALQDWRSRFLASENPAYGESERSQLGEARYASDRAQENRYFGAGSHPSETVDGIPYPRPLLETSSAASYWALSRDSTSAIANRDNSKDSRYVPSVWLTGSGEPHVPSVWLTGSGEPLSSVSRSSNLYEPKTETALLPSVGSALLSSEQPHVRGFGMSELPRSREASYSVSDRAQRREPRYTTDRSQENKYSTSDSRQRREPDPPRLRDTNYTASDRATSRNFESVTANRDRSRDSRYVPPNRDRSDNARFGGSDRLPSPFSGLSDLDEPLTETGTFQNRTSEQPRERGYGMSELPKLREASYSTSERAQGRESRYTSDRRRDDKYSNSADRQRPLEAVRGDPYPPPLLGMSVTAPDRALSRDSVTQDRDRSRDSRYVPPNRDRSDNARFRGSDRLPSPVSGLSDLDEPLTESDMLQNRTSTALSSEQPRERGYGVSEQTRSRESRYASDRHQDGRYSTSDQTPSRYSKSAIPSNSPSLTANRDRSREAGYSVSDRALRTEPRYTSDRQRDDKYSPSDSRRPLETVRSLLDPPQLLGTHYTASDWALSRNSESVTANRDRPRDSRHVLPGREQPENAGLRDSNWPLSLYSSFGNLDASTVRESSFRGSDNMQAREARFEESRLRLSDPQQYRELDNTVSRTRSREDRISPERSRSPYRSSRFDHFSRF